jgi:pyridoxamine 5'-phosphate oxidase
MSKMTTSMLAEFEALLEEAKACGEIEPTAMVLATVSSDGRISSRAVLLKAVSCDGFVFYTNTQSLKGQQLQDNPRAALLFHWKKLRNQVQVRIEGAIESVSVAEADAYFATRPRDSQIGAWASSQSERLLDRNDLIARIEHYEQVFLNKPVARPPHWSGYRVLPSCVEFWFGSAHRLHDRYQYQFEDGQWCKSFLYP